MKGKRLQFDYLEKYDKIIVTGPPRSGTTIGSRIIAKELGYKFIDESWYDGNNPRKFFELLHLPRKLVIQMTAFAKDIHQMILVNTCIVIMRREIEDILKSMKHSETFDVEQGVGMFTKFDDEAQIKVLAHYGFDKHHCLPEVIYAHLYKTIEDYYMVEYKSLKDHPLFIKREDRRKHFTHLKQVDLNPNYIKEKTGHMVI